MSTFELAFNVYLNSTHIGIMRKDDALDVAEQLCCNERDICTVVYGTDTPHSTFYNVGGTVVMFCHDVEELAGESSEDEIRRTGREGKRYKRGMKDRSGSRRRYADLNDSD